MNKIIHPSGHLLFSAFMLFLLSTACTPSNEEDEPPTEVGQVQNAAEIYQICGDTLFAAIYHNPQTHHLFEESSAWIAQPVSAFSDLLNEPQKEKLLTGLHNGINNAVSRKSAAGLSNSLTRWCRTYDTLNGLEEGLSREELLALLLDSDRFNYLFLSYQEQSVFREENFSSLDKTASLSSAQGNEIISTLITDLSMQRPEVFERDLELLSRLAQ